MVVAHRTPVKQNPRRWSLIALHVLAPGRKDHGNQARAYKGWQ
jgi:hypothetical protein